MDQNEWMPQETAEISVQDMDLLIQNLSDARDAYDAAKKISTAKYHELEEVEALVVNTLKAAGRTKFEAEGIAAVDIRIKEAYSVPKDNEDKARLYAYIRQQHGQDVLTSMLSIHHASLNSWANKEIENNPMLQIPGLAAPTSVETLYFRTKK